MRGCFDQVQDMGCGILPGYCARGWIRTNISFLIHEVRVDTRSHWATPRAIRLPSPSLRPERFPCRPRALWCLTDEQSLYLSPACVKLSEGQARDCEIKRILGVFKGVGPVARGVGPKSRKNAPAARLWSRQWKRA